MKVRNYLNKVISREGSVHLTLIDPDEQDPEEAGEMAYEGRFRGNGRGDDRGVHSAGGEVLDETVKKIKEATDVPTILFPSNEGGISGAADAIFFMSLLNSTNPAYITGMQKKGAPLVKKFGIEPISLAYLIIEPGGTAGRVGDADPIKRSDVEGAVAYSLASQYLGMESIYLEVGSGADEPIPVEMVEDVSEAVDSMIIVGGGIRGPEAGHRESRGRGGRHSHWNVGRRFRRRVRRDKADR